MANKIRLPRKSNVLDKIDMELTPYLESPIALIGSNRVKWIFCIAPTQSGKTVALQVGVADMIDQDPGPALYLLPDEKSAKKNVKEKIIDMIDSTPALSCHKTGRVTDINKLAIELDNMKIDTAWAGSAQTISSQPKKRVFLDELRLMKLTIGNESNAIQLAEDRLTTYLNLGIGQGMGVSSPSIEGDLLHSQLDMPGTGVFVWKTYCPHCENYQRLDFFTHIKINKETHQPECLCSFCKNVLSDFDQKRDLNSQGKYFKATLDEAGKWQDTDIAEDECDPSPRMVYWWSSMNSPFRTFKQIWDKYIETKDKLFNYRHFYQTWLSLFWIEDISKTSKAKLRERQSDSYSMKEVPAGIKVITVGIDTQDTGFYAVARGFGFNKFTALIDHFFVPCSIDIADSKEIIKILTRDIMSRVYISHEGVRWSASMFAIDTGGHRTKTIYEVGTAFPKLVLVKGRNNQDITISYNKDKSLYLVKTAEYLDETEIKCEGQQWVLPSNVGEDYLTQFVNIRKTRDTNKKTGITKDIWKKVGQCDYRMADIHTFICLDIPTDRGKFRDEIEKENFVYNPYMLKKIAREKKVSSPSSVTNFSEQNSNYNINDLEW